MEVKTFLDGSSELYNNVHNRSGLLNKTCDALEKLTEPQNIDRLTKQLIEKGILNDKDIVDLKQQGILLQKDEMNIELKRENVEKTNDVNEQIEDELEH